MIAPALAFLAGPLGRYALVGVALFAGVAWIRHDARQGVIEACKVKLETVDRQWRSQVEAVNKEASDRVALAVAESQATPDSPAAPAELERLCRSEPAGCRSARKP